MKELLPIKISRKSPQKNNERNLFSLIDSNFKTEIMKILKELRKTINRNAEYCKKQTRNYQEEPRKNRKLIY